MSASSRCHHPDFSARVEVHRIEDVPGLAYAELQIKCVVCDAPAVFRGLPLGISPESPSSSMDGQTAILPLVCEGDPEPPPSIGFRVERVR